MTNTLKQAMEKIETLPAATQERIGEELLLHVEKVRRLRAQLESAARSLDHDGGREINIEEIIKRAHAQHGEA
jgi:hypothetical protein